MTQEIFRKDYQAPVHLIPEIQLRVEIQDDYVDIFSVLTVQSQTNGNEQPLVLNGVDLSLQSLSVDGQELNQSQYQLQDEQLIIPSVPDQCLIQIAVRINPYTNTALEGFYRSGEFLLTQCEAEGFRKITYFPDRPDVMSKFTVRLEADSSRFPVLLCNGNLIESGDMDAKRHFATWSDPFPKPSYLFAMVAGDLEFIEDHFTTRDGETVTLRIYTEAENIHQCDHAMTSLKKSMKWDEDRFGLQYDLNIFNIVVTNDFNMGAMENKSLNIFNSVYVLARPETATDANYAGIEAVIGHEYFHNWSGNRVTCRDWFQLSLKEGLTVFRDQEFSSDMQSRAVKRIEDVRFLRASQFPEDAGPMSHPIRPDSFIEINNFYTLTVYEKGSEVVRMYHTLLGEAGFRKGSDLYFQRHDGQAVTCDDFRQAMADANHIDLSQFERWYAQSGTPVVTVSEAFDSGTGQYTLTLKQATPPTPGQSEKQPLMMPFALGLLDSNGQDLPIQLEGELTTPEAGTRILQFNASVQTFVMVGLSEKPTASLFRGFSAPIKLHSMHSDEDLAFLMSYDQDSFNRWDAAQQLARNILLANIKGEQDNILPPLFLNAFKLALTDTQQDPALIAETLALPSESYLADCLEEFDPLKIHQARTAMKTLLANSLHTQFKQVFEANQQIGDYAFSPEQVARRSLKNTCLSYLACIDQAETHQLVLDQHQQAHNMTDQLSALTALVHHQIDGFTAQLSAFRDKWTNEPLVLDKWFSLQASSPRDDVLQQVKSLMNDAAFSMTNPNKVRALIGAFMRNNPVQFHQPDGSGYAFLADIVLQLNQLNPQIAARMVSGFNIWKRLEPVRRAKMQVQLKRILDAPDLSPDVYEIANKALTN